MRTQYRETPLRDAAMDIAPLNPRRQTARSEDSHTDQGHSDHRSEEE
jgi:hypothetical protein